MSEINVVEAWKHLHATPELGFKEVKTSEWLAGQLEALGYEVTRGVGGTGVVGYMRSGKPGPVLMLRADMDALPFENPDGTVSCVHACGHDGHSAMVLASASRLAGKVKRGTLKILFQPGEETLNGALAVIKDHVLDDVDIALGCHVRPVQDIPEGTCCAAVRHVAGAFVKIGIKGVTSHASRPHLGVNAAEAAALVTLAVAAIKSNPALKWSCKVTSIKTESKAANIIPDKAEVMIDVRAQTNGQLDELLDKIRKAAECAAGANGAEAEVTLVDGVKIPAAVYNEDLVAEVAETIREELGADRLSPDCGGGGEDFHFFKLSKPSIKTAYFGVGAGCTPGLHARTMHFNPEQLEMGVRVLTAMALKKIG